MSAPQSLKNIVEIIEIVGKDSGIDQSPQVLIEIPHGATKKEHFEELKAQLSSEFPKDLIDFFFVNTDVGAPELAQFTAEILSRLNHRCKILIVRSLIPRTFIDCNRRLNLSENEALEAGITVGLPVYVKTASDKELLLHRYSCYQQEAEKAYACVCGAGGIAIMLHSYAPKSVGISAVREDIVERLHDVYSPEQYKKWSVRPQVDFIHQTPNNEILSHDFLRNNMTKHLERSGYRVAQGESYKLHPATTGYSWAKKYKQKTVCIELRRDLLVEHFEPFSEMVIDIEKMGRIATAMAGGILESLQSEEP